MSAQPEPKRLGTTAYAILGLLAMKEWSTYELATQMERGMGRMWSAAPSMVYEEPKHLVRRGLASVRNERIGRRPRAVYSITPAGRTVLAEWLAEAGGGPALQFESLLKVLFSDQGEPSDLRAVIRGVADYAEDSLREARHRAAGYFEGDYIPGVEIEPRIVIVALTLSFFEYFYRVLGDWAEWASVTIGAADGGQAEALRALRRIATG